MVFGAACRSCLLGHYVRRHGELTERHASVGTLWAITIAPDIVHSYVDDVVARNLAARASSAYTHVWAQLASAASAIATSSRYYSPASIYARLDVASSVAITATLDQLERTVCCADEMLSRVVSWLVLKPARVAYVLTSPMVRPLRSPAPYELYFQGPSDQGKGSRLPPNSNRWLLDRGKSM